MKNEIKRLKYTGRGYTIATVVILVIIAVIVRIPREDKEYRNSDATYHTLLTMQCYEETPIAVHKFLPIVSLGNEEDKNINWGACVESKNDDGNYYYTSFSPAGFVLPYLFVKIFNLPINEYSLYAFNSILYVATLIFMIIIFCKLFSKILNKNLIILFTTLIYLFQPEVMQSQGVVYWTHSIWQLLIEIQFLLFLNRDKKSAKIGFYAMCIIMPYVEWTGYFSNVAFALILFIKDIVDNKRLTLKSFIEPVIIGILTIASLGLYLGHFLMNVSDIKEILFQRFTKRNITASDITMIDLGKEYLKSYKYMLLICLFTFLVILCLKKYRKKLWEIIKEYKYVIIFFSFIMLENILLLQHAIAYTFDRLKFSYLLITMFYIMLSTIDTCKETNRREILEMITFILIGMAIINVIDYKSGKNMYIVEDPYEKNDKMMASYITENFNHSNSIICNKYKVRGYLNLLFHRGIYEGQTYETSQQITKNKNKRYLIFLDTTGLGNENIVSIIIEDFVENKKYRVSTKNEEVMIEEIGENEIINPNL